MRMQIPQKVIHKYLRYRKNFPHVWCPGCGIGIVLGDIIRAINLLKLEKDDIAMVSGIGCSSRMPVYIDVNTLHTTHGRPITFATGIKLAKPSMKVIVITGDGDGTAIGGNHFIHAARRNIDITVILINNNIYGMTGGQVSPTTPVGDIATTAPYGAIERNFDISNLAIAAGASFVARTTAFHTNEAQKIIASAISKEGFALVEVIAQCPVIYGRLNKMGSAVEMMKWQRDNTIPIESVAKLPEEKKKGKIIRGILVDRDIPEYTKEYDKLIERVRKQFNLHKQNDKKKVATKREKNK